MPTTLAETWFPVLLQAVLAMVIAAALVALSFAIGRRLKNKVKDMPYECGIAPTGDAQHRFSVKFYLVAMLFILFDIEAIFLYPWVVVLVARFRETALLLQAGVWWSPEMITNLPAFELPRFDGGLQYND